MPKLTLDLNAKKLELIRSQVRKTTGAAILLQCFLRTLLALNLVEEKKNRRNKELVDKLLYTSETVLDPRLEFGNERNTVSQFRNPAEAVGCKIEIGFFGRTSI